MFYCRNNELNKLNKRYEAGKFECVIIYGRRRVGKTSLISEFCKDKPTVFFSALNASSQENLAALSRALFEFKHPEAADAPVYESYDGVFREITALSEKERLIFVIDEYPYLAKAEKSVSSRLQHIIDHFWQKGKLFLILCGSSMSFMEHQVLGYESPLYGRRTAQLKIMPLSYRDIKEFNPALSPVRQSLIYGITGGIPLYINKLNVKDDIDEALIENFFDPSSYLFEEPQNLLKQELREPAIYNSVISAIANGSSRQNEIAAKIGIEAAACAKYLKSLTELGILKKEMPITENKSKKVIYVICDNFFRFWYRFVPKNMAAAASGRIKRIYEPAVKRYLPEYMGLVFEQMCRSYLMNYAENIPIALTDIGQWWGTDSRSRKEVQIDIVGTSAEKGEFIIGSCKYRNEKTGLEELELLKSYAAVFGKGSKYYYYIFSKSGFTEGLYEAAEKEGVRLVSLEDIYAE